MEKNPNNTSQIWFGGKGDCLRERKLKDMIRVESMTSFICTRRLF